MKTERDFARNIGKEIEVLFENETEGHTTNYIKVISDTKQKENIIEKVVVKEWKNGSLYVDR